MRLFHELKNRMPGSIKKAKRHLRYKGIVDLEKSQWWTYEKLERYQTMRLRKIVGFAYNNIPAYRKAFEKVYLLPQDLIKS